MHNDTREHQYPLHTKYSITYASSLKSIPFFLNVYYRLEDSFRGGDKSSAPY